MTSRSTEAWNSIFISNFKDWSLIMWPGMPKIITFPDAVALTHAIENWSLGVISSLWLYQTGVQTIQCVCLLMFLIKHVFNICNGFPLNAIPLFDVIGYVFPNLIFNIDSNVNTCAINIATHLTFKILADDMLTIAEFSHGKQRNYYLLSSKGLL